MRVLVCLALASLIPSLVWADASAGRELRGRWLEGAAAKGALAGWRGCKELAELFGPDEDDEFVLMRPSIEARRVPGGVEAEVSYEGDGRWGYGTRTWVLLKPGRCDAAGYSVEGGKEALWGGLRRLAYGGAEPPSLRTLDEWHGVVVEDVDRPELAAARLLVQLASNDNAFEPHATAEVIKWPIQPTQPGRPRGSPATIWTAGALARASVSKPWLESEVGDAFDAIATYVMPAPRLVRTSGPWEIWELRFRARLGGGLLAVYDRRSKRHRWLWATTYDNDGVGASRRDPWDRGSFRVRSLRGDVLTLVNVFDGREFVWEMDLRSGACRRLPSVTKRQEE